MEGLRHLGVDAGGVFRPALSIFRYNGCLCRPAPADEGGDSGVARGDCGYAAGRLNIIRAGPRGLNNY